MDNQLKASFININNTIKAIGNNLIKIQDDIKTIEKLKMCKNIELYLDSINQIKVLINDLYTINLHEFKDNKLNWLK